MTTRWQPVSPGRGLQALHPPARYLRPVAAALLTVGVLSTLWVSVGHIVPTPATLTQAAPGFAGRLVAGVRERLPASASATPMDSTAASPVVDAPGLVGTNDPPVAEETPGAPHAPGDLPDEASPG